MQPPACSQQMAGYPSLSCQAAYWVQPWLPCVLLCFWYIIWLTQHTSSVCKSLPGCAVLLYMLLLWNFYEDWPYLGVFQVRNLYTRARWGIWEQMVPRSLWWRKGALCRWVVTGVPGPSWLCQIVQGGCELEGIPLLVMLLTLSEKLRSDSGSGCGRAASALSTGQAALVKGNQFPL